MEGQYCDKIESIVAYYLPIQSEGTSKTKLLFKMNPLLNNNPTKRADEPTYGAKLILCGLNKDKDMDQHNKTNIYIGLGSDLARTG